MHKHSHYTSETCHTVWWRDSMHYRSFSHFFHFRFPWSRTANVSSSILKFSFFTRPASTKSNFSNTKKVENEEWKIFNSFPFSRVLKCIFYVTIFACLNFSRDENKWKMLSFMCRMWFQLQLSIHHSSLLASFRTSTASGSADNVCELFVRRAYVLCISSLCGDFFHFDSFQFWVFSRLFSFFIYRVPYVWIVYLWIVFSVSFRSSLLSFLCCLLHACSVQCSGRQSSLDISFVWTDDVNANGSESFMSLLDIWLRPRSLLAFYNYQRPELFCFSIFSFMSYIYTTQLLRGRRELRDIVSKHESRPFLWTPSVKQIGSRTNNLKRRRRNT